MVSRTRFQAIMTGLVLYALAALLNAIARGAPPRPVDLAEGY